MPKEKKPKVEAEPAVAQHTIRVPKYLEERVFRCMEREGMQTYNDFVLTALTRRCRESEREHRVDAQGKPVSDK